MKILFTLAIFICALRPSASIAATTVVSSQGKVIRFSDWTTTRNVSVPAMNGGTLLSRSCDATQQTDPLYSLTIDFLSNPQTGHYWIGKRCPKYAVFGNNIIGIEVGGSIIRIKKGFHSNEGSVDESAELSKRLQEFVESPLTSQPDRILNLTSIFGHKALSDPTDLFTAATLTDVEVGDRSIIVTFDSVIGAKLKIAFDSELIPISAEIDSKPVLLLIDGTERMPLSASSPKEIEIPSQNGPVSGIQIALDQPYIDEKGETRNYMTKSVVVPKSGLIWFGPDRCKLFLWGEKLVGIEENGMKLNVYL